MGTRSSRRFKAALALAVLVFPFVQEGAVPQELVLQGSLEEVHAAAADDRDRLRKERQEYGAAVEICRSRRALGEDITCPTISDKKLIRQLIRSTETETQEEEEGVTETEVTSSSLTTEQLSEADRLVLRRYTRAGVCPETLKGYALEGFFELCVSMVGKSAVREPVKGLISDKAKLRMQQSPGAPSIKKRLWQLKQGKDVMRIRLIPSRPSRLSTEKETELPAD